MPSFTDKTDQSWPIELNIGAVIRIRKESDGEFDLMEPAKNDLANNLLQDPCAFWEVLWYLTKPVAEDRGVSCKQFGDLMAGDCVLKAQKLFFDEWRDFFRQYQRPDKAMALDKMGKAYSKAMQLVMARLPDLERQVDDQIQSALNNLSGSLPDTSALTPSRSRSKKSG